MEIGVQRYLKPQRPAPKKGQVNNYRVFEQKTQLCELCCSRCGRAGNHEPGRCSWLQTPTAREKRIPSLAAEPYARADGPLRAETEKAPAKF